MNRVAFEGDRCCWPLCWPTHMLMMLKLRVSRASACRKYHLMPAGSFMKIVTRSNLSFKLVDFEITRIRVDLTVKVMWLIWSDYSDYKLSSVWFCSAARLLIVISSAYVLKNTVTWLGSFEVTLSWTKDEIYVRHKHLFWVSRRNISLRKLPANYHA